MPLYFKIEIDLRKKIMNGDYKPGDIMPSERNLVEAYQVSRLTVREAINRLVAQGLVVKKQGKGTYVAEYDSGHVDYMIGPLSSSSESFLLKNYKVKTKVIKAIKTVPTKELCDKLELRNSRNEEIFYLERLRYADSIPVAFIKCYLPYGLVEGVEKIDFSVATLYRTLEDYFRIELFEAYEVIEATKADRKSAKLLKLKPGDPVLLNQRTTYLKDGTIIEYEKVRYRPGIYKYHNKLIRRNFTGLE